ncbi:alpha/beta fold hydrolase [Deinococcus multiflagellatus]|uniref:alpha/beta fold hydrolase n=1 Tax=Deinococcus multiflagellatus TaxID=1656887 RepID=UPI001CCD633D|nr:alpha/beta fold hydrolase [Deinococcus multiflagellatus]MBZ9714311.1 alpha/beta hydrolase [Deinococcus multiflagellatus]
MRRPHALLLALLLTAPALAAPTEAQLNAVPATRVVMGGAVVPGTPANLNASITVRYGSAKPRAVLLLMPGFLGGAGSFDRLARQIVALNPTVAVWAVDRRSNLLEDHTSILKAGPAALAGLVKDGLPVRTPDSLPYLKDWGLDTTLKDWRVAVQAARALTPNVFLGGHSMGGTLSGLYAAYDFAGVPGARDVRGLVMLDGLPGLMSGQPLTADAYRKGASNPIGPLPGLDGLARAPYVDAVFFSPRLASRGAAQARLAQLDPSGRAPAGGLVPFPATNMAAAMTQLDQRYALIPFMAIKTGQATNATEATNLPTLALGGRDSHWIAGAKDPRQPVGWQADPAAPTDAADFVRRYITPLSDYAEWYFPQRLTLDLAAARTGTRGTPFEKTLPVWHMNTLKLPVLGIAAEQGVTTEAQYRTFAAGTQAQLTTFTLNGAAHLDIVSARGDQVARWIGAWMRPLVK